MCSNADGSDKIDIWFIGYYQNPRAFKNINRAALGCKWRFNRTAWNNSVIMRELLLWFQDRMSKAGRRVALVLDNFSAHECAVNELETESLLTNVHIIWLPPPTTSIFQPMDQGIIRTWKAHYRRSMMRYIIQYADQHEDGDPYDTINVLHALRWGVEAWRSLTPITLEHCFSASQIKLHGPYPSQFLPAVEPTEIEDEIYDCIRVAHPGLTILRSQLNSTFINPASEAVDDGDADIEERIINTFIPAEQEDPASEPPPAPCVPHQIAIDALKTLLLYSLQSDRNTSQLEDILQRERRRIEGYVHSEKAKQTQRRITEFLHQS